MDGLLRVVVKIDLLLLNCKLMIQIKSLHIFLPFGFEMCGLSARVKTI